MPLSRALGGRRFPKAGPVLCPRCVGEGLAAMLLCLQHGQWLEAPAGDDAGRFAVARGEVVHVLPGRAKALKAGAGAFAVLGVRRLAGRRHG